MKNSALPFLILSTSLYFAGCTKDPLTPLVRAEGVSALYGAVDAHICTSAPTPAQQNLKYLFILDHSASNQPGFPSPLTPNDVSSTDPEGSRRYGPLVNFVKNLAPQTNTSTSFGLIDFNDTATQPQGLTGFDSSASDFLTRVTTDWIGGGTAAAPSPNDSGFTNYQSALNLALSMIQADAEAQATLMQEPIVTTSYVIVFVSDGIPTIATPSGPNPTYTQSFTTDLSPVIQSILNLKNAPTIGPQIASITLNTAYYDNGTQIIAAETLLGQMANAGNGQYLQFDSGQNILYQQFAPPSRNIRNLLTDVFVENQNLVWWSDGTLMVDSDGDGLPDSIEIAMGSNPNLADSDGNGVSDLVEYRTKGQPCNAAGCTAAGRDSYAFCAGFSPVTNADGSITFTSSTNDGLNDCEKFALGASRISYNSNGDLVPDDFAFRSWLPIIPGSSSTAFSDPFNDGINNYNKLKNGLPLLISMTKLLNFSGQTTTMTQEASGASNTDCYHVQVDHIALTAYSNSIKMMIIQNSSVLQNKPFLQSATKLLYTGTGPLSFAPGDFQ